MTTGTRPAAPAIRDDKAELKAILEAFPTTEKLMQAQVKLSLEEQQRHRPFMLLTMRLVKEFWNGNYSGSMGSYPYRKNQLTGELYSEGKKITDVYDKGATFFGYNIAALAVDGKNNVIDFEFNHNELFKSSMEHAEARLMRRLFSLTGLRSEWSLGDEPDDTPDDRHMTNLKEVTVYTTLEPCAQCAGIMALARVKEVVYLQRDPGARSVVDVLYNLKPYGVAVKPIAAIQCGLPYGETLAEKYEEFWTSVQKLEPFYIGPKGDDRTPRLTKFLCTDVAQAIFSEGAGEFDMLKSGSCPPVDIDDLKKFLEYAKNGGHRGTPH